jgi:Ca2+-binding RTX toxin-like protein
MATNVLSQINVDTEVIGKVVSIRGDAVAESESGKRFLTLNSAIHSGEIVQTMEGAHLEIRFADGSLLSQDGDSTIELDDYVYEEDNAGTSQLLFEMTQGAFRMVTGKIAEENPGRFKMASPLATIGIRGTTTVHEIRDGYETHGAEEIHGRALVIEDMQGQLSVITEPQMVTMVTASGIQESRSMTPYELEQFQTLSPMSFPQMEYEGDKLPSWNDTDGFDQFQTGDDTQQQLLFQDQVGGLFQDIEEDNTLALPSEGVAPNAYSFENLDDLTVSLGAYPALAENDASAWDYSAFDAPDLQYSLPGEAELFIYANRPQVLHGTADADVLSGGRGDDRLYGYAGNDVLNGGRGDDLLDGGDGDDLLAGGPGVNDIIGGAGMDIVTYADLHTAVNLDLQTGSAWHDPGHDTLTGVEGAIGSNQADSLIGDALNNYFKGNGGNDYLDTLAGGDNVMLGGTGDDQLNAGAGNDTLVGGANYDSLTGNGGSDVFFWNGIEELDQVTNGNFGTSANYDTTDFITAVDEIWLSSTGFQLSSGSLSADDFGTVAGYDGTNGVGVSYGNGDPSLIFDSTNSLLIYDPNGTGDGYYVIGEFGSSNPVNTDVEVVDGTYV